MSRCTPGKSCHVTDLWGKGGVWGSGEGVEADRLDQSHEGREVRGRTGRDASRVAGVSESFL